jgi:hypothetical protein
MWSAFYLNKFQKIKKEIGQMDKFFNEWLYPMGLGLMAGIAFATLIFLGV